MKNKFYLLIAGLLAVNVVLLFLVLKGREKVTDRQEVQGEPAEEQKTTRFSPPIGPGYAESMRKMMENRRGKVELPKPRAMDQDLEGLLAQELLKLADQIENTADPRTKLELIRELQRKAHPEVVNIARGLQAEKESIVRAAGLGAVLGYGSPEAFGLAVQGLKDPDHRVRAVAVRILATARPEDMKDIVDPLADAAADPEPMVNEAAREIVKQIPYEERLQIVSELLLAQDVGAVREATLHLQSLSNEDAMKSLIAGLDNPDPKIQEEINDTIHYLIGVRFRDRESGESYWANNKDKYGEGLVEQLD